MMKREITAAVGIVVIAGILFFGSYQAFQILAFVAASAAVVEICLISTRTFATWPIWFTLPLAWAWMATILLKLPVQPVFFMSFFIPPVAVLLSKGILSKRFHAFLILTTVPFCVGISSGYLMALRSHFGDQEGVRYILLLLIMVWVGDSAAYYAGRYLGKHKIAPRVSPNKTVEGTIALMVTTTLIGLVGNLITGEYSLPLGLALGFSMGLGAFLGDMSQSLYKRALDVKDSGSIFPGHGGFWDRMDSILWCAVVLYAFIDLV